MAKALEGRSALVTGAAGKIGRAIAEALAEAGADVAVHDRKQSDGLSAAAKGVDLFGRRSVCVDGDVRDEDAVARFIRDAVVSLGKLDILVNNAGVMTEAPLLGLSLDAWKETIDINLTGCFLCSKAAAEHMIGRGTGTIINIASQLAYRGGVGSHTTVRPRPAF